MFLFKNNKKLDLELLHMLIKDDEQENKKALEEIESAYYRGTRVKKSAIKEKYNLGKVNEK